MGAAPPRPRKVRELVLLEAGFAQRVDRQFVHVGFEIGVEQRHAPAGDLLLERRARLDRQPVKRQVIRLQGDAAGDARPPSAGLGRLREIRSTLTFSNPAWRARS